MDNKTETTEKKPSFLGKIVEYGLYITGLGYFLNGRWVLGAMAVGGGIITRRAKI